MTPQYIMRKSLCRTPHCSGPYELRDTPLSEWPQAARDAVVSSAESEIECLDYATEYAERGYDQPRKGILFANWNHFPRGLGDLLEEYGYSIEWSDEWTTCENCGNAYRISPDSYSWQPSGLTNSDRCVCVDCIDADDLADLENDPGRAVNVNGLDLKTFGYVEIECGFESGWHPGQNDNPVEIAKGLLKQGYKNILFQVSDTSQFSIGFCVWHKPEEE